MVPYPARKSRATRFVYLQSFYPIFPFSPNLSSLENEGWWVREETDDSLLQCLDEVFNVHHPIFHWAFRASRNWRAMVDLIPCMRHHLHDDSAPIALYRNPSPTGPGQGSPSASADEPDEQTIRFQEIFAVAASDLAKQMGEPLDHLGVLYDEVVMTGTRDTTKSYLFGSASSSVMAGRFRRCSDLESASPPRHGPGQLLFLVRGANKSGADRLRAHGFRFTAVPLVFEALAETLQVHPAEVMSQLESMRLYATTMSERCLEKGVHVACFGLRASVAGAFDVLVRRTTRNLLPSSPLGLAALDDSQVAFLRRLDGLTVMAEATESGNGDGRSSSSTTGGGDGDGSIGEKAGVGFATRFRHALSSLMDDLDDPLFHEARLMSGPVYMPGHGGADSYFATQATIIAFRLMVPIHARASNPRRYLFSPLAFFRCQQYAYGPSSDHEVFSRRMHRDFAPVVESTTQSTVVYRPASEAIPRLTPSRHGTPGQRRAWWDLSSLERRWSQVCTPEVSKTAPEPRSWGGILVSQEVNVNIDAVQLTPMDGAGFHLEGEDSLALGSSGIASADVGDRETFVDQLLVHWVEGR